MTAELDPITLEVLRHRLMMINDEQGRVAARLSGSPVVYEAKDFNSALLTAEGDSLFVGIYMTRLSLCLNTAVKTVIERFGTRMGFHEGDAFVTNDPWAGAAHMNDILMFSPIFHEGTLVCWTGLAMHEIDVGGPNPGSFTVGTPDVFGEAPLIPPIKLIDRGELREDVEALVVRNSRTAQINGLNIRARIAAIGRTRQRIGEVIAEYGLDAMMVAQRKILELTQKSFARRLRGLPDGTWSSQGYLDHDGNTNELYKISLRMTKAGEQLTFDFRGTAKQARGAVNCTRVGLESGVFSAILPMLCYDMPWCPGGIMPLISIISDPGTINNATHPAAVSMATVSATFATAHVTYGAIAKMLASSPLVDEVQANWAPAWQGAAMAGRWRDGRPFTAVFLDNTGGSGGRAWKDGIDAGGLPGAPAMAIGNVEAYEKENPVLYVYRKQAVDTGGAGRFRGGVGTQSLIIPHGAEGDIDCTVLCHGASQPEAQGLFGGYPSSVQVRLILRDTHLAADMLLSRLPASHEDVRCDHIEALAAKQRVRLGPQDALMILCAGGAGYGDPLARDPERVAIDVRDGLVSPAMARGLYGVALRFGDTGWDQNETAILRADIRARRRAEAPSTAGNAPLQRVIAEPPALRGRIGDAMTIRGDGGAAGFCCADCDQFLGRLGSNPLESARLRTRKITELSAWNRFGLVDRVVAREFCCPSCGHLLSVQVAQVDDPILHDVEFGGG